MGNCWRKEERGLPLLSQRDTESLMKRQVSDDPYRRHFHSGRSASKESAKGFAEPEWMVLDAMTYNERILMDWRVFMVYGVSEALEGSAVLKMTLRLLLLSGIVAFTIVVAMPNPTSMESSKFHELGTFLKVVVGLLLSFYIKSGVMRWFQCLDGFMQLFDSVRTLQMQFFALGVSDLQRAKVLRYGILSGWLLANELRSRSLPEGERDKANQESWERLASMPESSSVCYLTKEEVVVLKDVDDPGSCIWMWVSSLLGRLAQDGEVPPMASPTWGRLMAFVGTAHSSIRRVKVAMLVRAPFAYVGVLSTLVHINNIINSISFGISGGVAIGSILMGNSIMTKLLHYRDVASAADIFEDLENAVVATFINFLGPMIYQMLLEIGVSVAEPFKYQGKPGSVSAMPISRLLRNLERDMRDGLTMGTRCPSWEPPKYATKS